jgi:hypothetical protein
MLPQPTGNLLPTANQQLTKNPMLPGLPATGNMDSQYIAQEAQLRAQISQQYADVLQKLGYIDENGNFLPGSTSVNAARQESDLTRQSDLAGQAMLHQGTQGGTVHSGRLGFNTAREQQPYQRQIAQLGVDTPIALGGLYEQAAGLVDQYTLQNNLYLASMAARQAAAITAHPGGDDTTGGTGGGTGGDLSGGDTTGGGTGTQNPQLPAGPQTGADRQFPDPIVNQNPAAPGQVFVPDNSGIPGVGDIPKPNPAAYGQPDPTIVSQGGPMAPGSELVDGMPKPNPAEYGQPIPAQGTNLPTDITAPGSNLVDGMPKPNPAEYGQPVVDIPQILDTINSAIHATPPPSNIAAGQAAVNAQPGKVANKSKKGNLI